MNKQELGELVLASESTLYHVAYSILHNDALCADAAQESIAIAFSKINTLKNDDYAKTWLVRILINECYRLTKQQKRQLPLESGWEPEVCESPDYSDLYEALDQLTPDNRLAVTLYYLEGFSISEIADLAHTTTGTVKSRLARSRKMLRTLLEAM